MQSTIDRSDAQISADGGLHKDMGWSAGSLLNGRGNNTWPATAGGAIVFGSTRNAVRLQRDITQQIYLIAVQ
ncbi:hypothetical protein [Acidicapsa ligni]|uniref:hypothetical protein n=1 Tax=Acidicapsa ligni TaxID=542300 RepID=UPI0021E05D53|nr:hypothetical protein [Acidicapsa ligni]